MSTSSSVSNACDNMIESQIRTGHVLDERILAALRAVAREQFVPISLQDAAYTDEEIALGNGRFILEPLAFARLLEAAALTSQEMVLDIAVGTGYCSAVISHLAKYVIALEEDPAMAEQAKTMLSDYKNVEVVTGALAQGYHLSTPYDVIIIEGAVEVIPQAIADQLKEGGRLLTFEQAGTARLSTHGFGYLVQYQKVGGTLYKTLLQDTGIPLLQAFRKPHTFAL